MEDYVLEDAASIKRQVKLHGREQEVKGSTSASNGEAQSDTARALLLRAPASILLARKSKTKTRACYLLGTNASSPALRPLYSKKLHVIRQSIRFARGSHASMNASGNQQRRDFHSAQRHPARIPALVGNAQCSGVGCKPGIQMQYAGFTANSVRALMRCRSGQRQAKPPQQVRELSSPPLQCS